MTEPTEVERALQAVLRERAGTLAPPVEPYQAVTRRRRRGQRRLVLAAAVAVAVTAVGVPVTLRAASTDPTGPAATAARPSNGVRGSLAGDTRLLAEAVRVAREDFDGVRLPGRSAVGQPRPVYAEQRDGTVLVLVRTPAADRSYWTWVGRPPGAGSLRSLVTNPHDDSANGLDRRDGTQYADPMWLVDLVAVNGVEFGVVIVPPDAGVVLRAHTVLGSDCSYAPESTISMRADGTAMFKILPRTSPRVEVFDRAGDVVIPDRPVPLGGGNNGPLLPEPTTAEVNELLAQPTGEAPRSLIVAGLTDLRLDAALVENRKQAYLLRWAGREPGTGEPMALLGARLDGGATAVTLQMGTLGNSSAFSGCVPTADLNSRVIAGRIGGQGDDSSPLFVVAPPQAVRAEVVFRTGAVVPLQLAAGGGVLNRRGEVRTVRAYDAGGRLLDERAPELPRLPVGYV